MQGVQACRIAESHIWRRAGGEGRAGNSRDFGTLGKITGEFQTVGIPFGRSHVQVERALGVYGPVSGGVERPGKEVPATAVLLNHLINGIVPMLVSFLSGVHAERGRAGDRELMVLEYCRCEPFRCSEPA